MDQLPGKEHSGEFIRGDANPRVGLAVLEEYVVAWFILLYEDWFRL